MKMDNSKPFRSLADIMQNIYHLSILQLILKNLDCNPQKWYGERSTIVKEKKKYRRTFSSL